MISARADIFARKARILLARGQYKTALDYIEEAISLKNRIGKIDHEYLLTKAEILKRLNKKEAILLFKEIYSMTGNIWIMSQAVLNLFDLEPDTYKNEILNFIKEYENTQRINLIIHLLFNILAKINSGEKQYLELCGVLPIISASLNKINPNIKKRIKNMLERAEEKCFKDI